MPSISKDIASLKGQPMFNILTRCRELERNGRIIKHFELGDPDFNTPKTVTQKAIESLINGNTHYQSSRGDLDFLNSVQKATKISRNFRPSISQITVTTGANAAIFYALKTICNREDQVILPNPYFPTYIAAAHMAGVNYKFYNLDIKNKFKPSVEEITSLITPNTKAILINSPSNPLGSIIEKRDLEKIYEIACKKDIYIISDEVYSRMVYVSNFKFFSVSEIDQCLERTILINGFSKAFAMTGWRVGIVIAPPIVSEKITLLSESIVSCVPGFVQDAANEALLLPQNETKLMYGKFRDRQLKLIDEFQKVEGIECLVPEGAMYVFPSIKAITNDSEKFALHLLETAGIACVPGIYFGQSGEGYLRFSCAGSDENIAGLAESINYSLDSFN